MISKIIHSLADVKHINLFYIAFKMLINSKKKFIGMVIGATLSAFIIMQQPSIYQGIIDRIVAPISAIKTVDLWVMGADSYEFSDPYHFSQMDVYRIRSIPGVLWAKQLHRTWYHMYHPKTNQSASWELIGVDPQSLLGLPEKMIAGTAASIQDAKSIILDGYALKRLETTDKKTAEMGDTMIEGGNTWTIKGITKPLRTYMIEPKAYMVSNHIPDVAHKPSFILVKLKPSFDINQIANEINKTTSFLALTPKQFIKRANEFFCKKTPIVIIFIVIAIIGFSIGLVMMWQIFSTFVLTHIHQFGMLKMMGVSSSSLIKMVLFQAVFTNGLGYFIGLFLNVIFGFIFYDTTIAFHLTWEIIFLGIIGSLMIIIFSTYFTILKVLRMDTVELCRDLN